MRYFISFATFPTMGFGCTEVELDRPIAGMKEIQLVQDAIVEKERRRGVLESVTIINWKRFEEETCSIFEWAKNNS